MDQATRDHYRRILTEMKKRLEARKQEVDEVPMRQDGISPLEEDLQPYLEMEHVIATSRTKMRMGSIEDVRHALQVLRETPEDFGLCEECEEDIEEKRLELMPYVRLCLSCQSKAEAKAALFAAGGRGISGDFPPEEEI